MKLLLSAVLVALLTGCGSTSNSPAADTTPTTATTPAASPTPTPTPAATPSTIAEIQSLFPRGYPKVVAVSTLPDQVRSWYQPTYKKAMAIAPGVWAGMPPGASMFDVYSTGSFDGFCGSIKAYGRKYLKGVDPTGTCW